jgi:Zn-dependent protease
MSSQPAFRLFGFPVHVRPGFYMFMVLVVIVNGPDFGLWLAGFIAALTLIHELGHAFAARATGARAEISLDLLAGYASFVPTRHLKRWERAGISFAGPAIQIAIGAIGVWAMGYHSLHELRLGSNAAQALFWAGPVIGVFNLLPILPFDGGNIVLAGLEVVLGAKAKVVMLYSSLAITIGGGLWLLTQPRWGTFAIYAAIFPLMAQFQMLRAHRESNGPPSGLAAAEIAEAMAWRNGNLSLMVTGQVPSPWYRANQQLQQTSPEIARAVLMDDFASTGPARWVPPETADVATLRKLVALLPQPLPTGNTHAEQTLAGVLLRIGEYDTAAHYAGDSYGRAASPISAMVVARSAAALGDRDTATGWLRAAETLASPGWIDQQLRGAPELAQIAGRTPTAADFG